MVLDSAGYSRLTAHRGIIHALARIRGLCDTAARLVADGSGTIVKIEADITLSRSQWINASAANGAFDMDAGSLNLTGGSTAHDCSQL